MKYLFFKPEKFQLHQKVSDLFHNKAFLEIKTSLSWKENIAHFSTWELFGHEDDVIIKSN